jgi:hypothetical protein
MLYSQNLKVWRPPTLLFFKVVMIMVGLGLRFCDALLGPGVNPLEGSPNVKLRKLGPQGTLPASNFKRG